MNKANQEEFIKRNREINDTLQTMITYLKRNEILIKKLKTYNIPSSHIEEWGEFLVDFGNALNKWGKQNQSMQIFLLNMFRIENDD